MFINDRKLNLKSISQKLKEIYLLNLAGTLIVKHRVVFDQYTPCPELDASYSLESRSIVLLLHLYYCVLGLVRRTVPLKCHLATDIVYSTTWCESKNTGLTHIINIPA